MVREENGPVRHWCFTSFADRLVFGSLVSGYAYQQEKCPQSARVHWQGYIEFNRGVRMSQAKLQLGDQSVHLERRNGTREQAIAYATKIETRIAGPWVSGSCKSGEGQGRRTDLLQVAEEIKEHGVDAVKTNHPVVYIKYHRGLERLAEFYAPAVPAWRDLHVTWLWGTSGIGKTRWAYDQDPNLFRLMLPNKGGVIWWDGYTNQDTLLIDDLDGEIPFRTLLHYLDGYKLRVQVKGGTVNAYYTKVIVTSNNGWWHMYTGVNHQPIARRVHCVLELTSNE